MKTFLKSVTLLNSVFEREFNPKEIAVFLSRYGFKFWSWGVSKIYPASNKGLILKVNGHHLKGGYVVITLDHSDTFRVNYLNRVGRLVNTDTDVYIDELFDTIDKQIEYISEYAK